MTGGHSLASRAAARQTSPQSPLKTNWMAAEDPQIRGDRAAIGEARLSSLVYSVHKSPWSKAQKRLYQRILSGFECARRVGDHVRVMTLTSALDSPEDIHHSFEVLKKRIRRAYGRFEYVSVKELTKEGLEHLHLVYRGKFIAQKWLSEVWDEVHGAKIVWIARLYSWKLAKHLARYFIKEGIGRFWMSWGWVYRGFVHDWKIIVSKYGKFAVRFWKDLLFHGHSVKINDCWEIKPPWVSQKLLF